MRPVEYYALLIKKKLSNSVDSTKQDPYSRRAYFCVQNRIVTGCLKRTQIFVGSVLQVRNIGIANLRSQQITFSSTSLKVKVIRYIMKLIITSY